MFVPDYYKEIRIVEVNREPPRTSFVSHDDKDEAIANITNFEKSPYYINLNGKWEFYFNEYPNKVPKDIITNINQNDPNWCIINVPGNWELQGHGTAIYTDEVYDFCPNDPNPPFLPEKNPVGIYRKKDVKIPTTWIDQGRDIYLQIGAAKAGLYVYVNGQEVGYNEDSKDPADFLINDYIHKDKDNNITLVVFKYCTGSYLEDQDMWRLGGIERDVVLYSQPKVHIRDFKVISTLDDECQNGIFKLSTNVVNHSEQKNIDVTVGFEILDIKNDNNVVIHDEVKSSIESGKEKVIEFDKYTIENVRKWSAEHPNLYILLLTLKMDSDNSTLEIVSFRIGFKREEMYSLFWNNKNRTVLLLNGMPVIYKGVNIHEHNEKTGHYVTEDIRLKDIELLKRNNFNALRFSHYPNCRRLYELCDEYGFYVYNECNIESHGMGFDQRTSLANRHIWEEAHMDRTKNMYERSKNHACVTFFSLGNEAGNGCNFFKTYAFLKEQEYQRPVNYECTRWKNNTDMFVPQYPKAKDLVEMSECIEDKPIVPSEYQHAMGNANGNFNTMWKLIYSIPNLQGGFIWDWVDQGLLAVGKKGRKYWAYGGDFGGPNVPSDGNFCINGCVNPDRTPHPAMAEFKYSQQNIGFEVIDIKKGTFRITNRFFFTDLSEYEIICTITSNERIVKQICLSNTNENIKSLEPQESVDIDLHSEINLLQPKINTEYFVNFQVLAKTDNQPFIPIGFEIAHDQFRLPIEPLPKPTKHETGPELSITSPENSDSIVISSTKVEFVFNKKEGIVKSYKVDGYEYISNEFGFQPNFWRAPTDNDYGNGGPFREKEWKKNSHNFKINKCESIIKNNVATLTIQYKLKNKNRYEIIYHIFPSGIIKIDANYYHSNNTENKYSPNLPRLGIRFRVHKEMNNVSYFGRGPEENYADRCSGTRIDLFKTTAENLYFPYVKPQENGHHMDTRWLAVHDSSSSKGILICADKVIEFNCLRNSVEDFDVEDDEIPYQHAKFSKSWMKKQRHIDDIFPRDFVEINVDFKQQGLAGFNSWEDRVLTEFTISANENHKFGFTIIPFETESEIPEKIKYDYK